jgi:mannose-6-phosphate isomerase-like protein (cupin superfamily)
MAPEPIVVAPGEGHRLGNVEFLARTADTPRFNFSIIEIVAGRELEAHVHDDEDDAFYILEGELTFIFGGEEASAPPGTFVLVPPGWSTASATAATSRSGCSTSTPRPDSTAGSA